MGRAGAMQRAGAYTVALAAVGLAVIVTWGVPAFRERTPFLLVLGAAFVSAAYGGLGPGLFATFVGGLATDYFLVPPVGSAIGGPEDLERLALCLTLGTMTSYTTAAMRQASSQRAELLRHAEEARVAAEAANRGKDEFLAMVSHELRSPLAAIRMWASVLRGGRLGPEQAERALRSIDEATATEARLVSDLLDVSRIGSGKLRLDFRPTDLATAAATALEATRANAADKHIRLEASLAAAPVWGDPGRLQQVVWNLVGNAVKFTPEGGHVRVRVDVRDGTARLTVRDDGEGIAPEMLPHVFDRFRQGEGGRQGGLGLGLAIVRHLVESHGGTVQAESAGKGKGTTLAVALPLRTAPDTFAVTTAPAPPRTSLAGIDVLVVEDEPEAREAIARVLQSCGAHVRAVGSAAAAVIALGEAKADVLVSDIAMPDEDGYRLLNRLRTTGIRIRAAALTAHAAPEDRRRALAGGFEAHLAKPVDPAELIDVIARLGTAAAS